jgi:hypothetical protein
MSKTRIESLGRKLQLNMTNLVAQFPASTSLRSLGLKGITAFTVSFGRHHAFPPNASDATDIYHPRYIYYQRRYLERNEPLWWNCITLNKVASKKCVRAWITRRSRVAITSALGRKGYARDGSRLPCWESTGSVLYGTAVFRPTDKLLLMSWKELNNQADAVVVCLEEALRESGGSFRKIVLKRNSKIDRRS